MLITLVIPSRLLWSVLLPLHAVSDSLRLWLVLLHAPAGLLLCGLLHIAQQHQRAPQHPCKPVSLLKSYNLISHVGPRCFFRVRARWCGGCGGDQEHSFFCWFRWSCFLGYCREYSVFLTWNRTADASCCFSSPEHMVLSITFPDSTIADCRSCLETLWGRKKIYFR